MTRLRFPQGCLHAKGGIGFLLPNRGRSLCSLRSLWFYDILILLFSYNQYCWQWEKSPKGLTGRQNGNSMTIFTFLTSVSWVIWCCMTQWLNALYYSILSEPNVFSNFSLRFKSCRSFKKLLIWGVLLLSVWEALYFSLHNINAYF